MRCAAAAQQALRYVALNAARSGCGAAARAPACAAHLAPQPAAACALSRWPPDGRRHAGGAACFPSSGGRRGARRRAAPRLFDLIEAAGGSRGERGDKAQPAPSSRAPPGVPSTAINFNRKRTRLAIVLYPDPRLRAPNEDITAFDAALKLLAGEMFDVMYRRVCCRRACATAG
jgi:hypothetical protein